MKLEKILIWVELVFVVVIAVILQYNYESFSINGFFIGVAIANIYMIRAKIKA